MTTESALIIIGIFLAGIFLFVLILIVDDVWIADGLTQKIKRLADTCAELCDSVDLELNRNNELQTQIVTTESKLGQANGTIQYLRSKLVDRDIKIEDLKSDIKDLSRQAAIHSKAIEVVRECARVKESKIKDLSRYIKTLEKKSLV